MVKSHEKSPCLEHISQDLPIKAYLYHWGFAEVFVAVAQRPKAPERNQKHQLIAGKHPKNYGKIHHAMNGKTSTISTGPFSIISCVTNYHRVAGKHPILGLQPAEAGENSKWRQKPM